MKKLLLFISIIVAASLCACGKAPREDLIVPTNYVSEAQYNKATSWLSTNDERVAAAMRKAESGEDVTIACIGGSITEGVISEGDKDDSVYLRTCYANFVRKWWVDRYPDINVNFVNAGIGGTDSCFGLQRVKEDVLDANPDLVIIEFAVNDANDFKHKSSYEYLVREVLDYDTHPAVVLLFMGQTNGITAQGDEIIIGNNYELPMISYINVINDMISEGEDPKILSGDGVHPSAYGHAIAGELFWKYFNSVYSDMYEYKNVEKYDLPDALTSDRMKNADVQ